MRGGVCMAQSDKRKGILARALSVFADIRPGEVAGALLLTLNVFLLLGSYYILKTARESLILSEQGAEVKSYAAAGQAALLLFLVPAYSWLSSKVNRIRLFTYVTLFFISNLIIFYAASVSGAQVGVPFFIWVGIYNTMIIAQFWVFANDLYNETDGKRLFPILGVGASLGALAGATISGRVFAAVGPNNILLLTCATLLACIGLTFIVHRREGQQPAHRRKAVEPLAVAGGFRLILSDRYLMLIAAMTVLSNLVNTTGEYLFGRLVSEHAHAIASGDAQKTMIAQIYGDYFSWVNLLGLLFQLFVVSRIFKYLGVRGALFILPCIALGSYGLMALYPMFSIVRYGKILENSTDYSIQNTARHGLFLVTSREAKYKAQTATETIFWRFGDLLQAAVVLIGTSLAFTIRSFALTNMVMVLVWLSVVIAIYRLHKRRAETVELAEAA